MNGQSENIIKNLFKKAVNTQFKKNVLSGSIIHGLNVVMLLISYPVFINFLGFELFSVWALLSIVTSFAKMGELGISRAVISFTAKAKTEGDFIEICRIFTASVLIILIPSILVAAVLWFFGDVVVKAIGVPVAHQEISIITVKYIGIAIGSYILYDILTGIVSGFGRLDISNAVLLLLNFFKILVTIAFLSLGFSLLGMAYAILLSNTLFIFLMLSIIVIKFKINILRFELPYKKNFFDLLKFGFSIILMQILNMFSAPFVKIVLSKTVGIEAVGMFELAFKAAYSIRSFVEKGLFAILPEIASIAWVKKTNELKKSSVLLKVKTITFKIIYFALPVLLFFLAFAPFWLKIWLGDNYSQSILFSFWLLQPGIVAGMIALPSYFSLMATGLEQHCLYEAVIRTILLIAFSAVFVLGNLQEFYLILFFSMSVIFSNLYIIVYFRNKFKV